MAVKKSSKDYEYGITDYFCLRVKELEAESERYKDESKYYRAQLSKSHEILGRVIHQASERWDSVNLTEFFPTDNLHGKRSGSNPTGRDA